MHFTLLHLKQKLALKTFKIGKIPEGHDVIRRPTEEESDHDDNGHFKRAMFCSCKRAYVGNRQRFIFENHNNLLKKSAKILI